MILINSIRELRTIPQDFFSGQKRPPAHGSWSMNMAEASKAGTCCSFLLTRPEFSIERTWRKSGCELAMPRPQCPFYCRRGGYPHNSLSDQSRRKWQPEAQQNCGHNEGHDWVSNFDQYGIPCQHGGIRHGSGSRNTGMQAAPPSKLRETAALWDNLAELHSQPSFRSKFMLELHRLNQFQRDYPGCSTNGLVSVLDGKIRTTIIRTLPADHIRTAA